LILKHTATSSSNWSEDGTGMPRSSLESFHGVEWKTPTFQRKVSGKDPVRHGLKEVVDQEILWKS